MTKITEETADTAVDETTTNDTYPLITNFFIGTGSPKKHARSSESNGSDDGTEKSRKKRRVEPKRYDYTYLKSYVQEHNIQLINQADLEMNRVNSNTQIYGKCLNYDQCDNFFNKIFKCMVRKGGAYCRSCCMVNRRQKIKKKIGRAHV